MPDMASIPVEFVLDIIEEKKIRTNYKHPRGNLEHNMYKNHFV